jgi:hypothetical protein
MKVDTASISFDLPGYSERKRYNIQAHIPIDGKRGATHLIIF